MCMCSEKVEQWAWYGFSYKKTILIMSVGVCVCVCYLVFLSSICSTQWEFHFDYFPPQCHGRANLDIVFLNWKQRRPYVSSRIITFVWAIEPEPVAIFSLQSWSATSSKAIASYLYLFGVPVPFSGTLNQNWTNMVHCQVTPSVFFYLSIIRYGAIQGAIFLQWHSSDQWDLSGIYCAPFSYLESQEWQMRIMCNIARRICYTWLIRHGKPLWSK